jgi:hypothetical protein
MDKWANKADDMQQDCNAMNEGMDETNSAQQRIIGMHFPKLGHATKSRTADCPLLGTLFQCDLCFA